jgi:hypothetical protein
VVIQRLFRVKGAAGMNQPVKEKERQEAIGLPRPEAENALVMQPSQPTVVERLVPLQPLMEIGRAYLKRMGSPVKAFALGKAAMFASYAGAQVALQFEASGATGQGALRLAMSEPTLGAVIVGGTVVVLLAGANLVAYLRYMKGVDQWRRDLLEFAKRPGASREEVDFIIKKVTDS